MRPSNAQLLQSPLTEHTAILLIADYSLAKINSLSLFTTHLMQIILQLPHYMILSGTYTFVSECNLGLNCTALLHYQYVNHYTKWTLY